MRSGSNEATSAPKNCALKMKTNRGGKKILRKISTSANTAVVMASVLANARGRIVIMKPYPMLGECRVKCNLKQKEPPNMRLVLDVRNCFQLKAKLLLLPRFD